MQSPTFSIYKPNSNSASFGRFLEGVELQFCYDTETEISAGLTRVKAKTLSESGRVSQVRSGYGSGNQVKAFSLSRGDQVSLGKLKTLSRACFSLIPQPGLG
jgi:hypothetical protein